MAATLGDLRDDAETAFFKAAKLPTKKADTEDVAGVVAVTATEKKILEAAIDEMTEDAYSDAIYSSSEALISVAWNQARELLNITSGFDVPPTWAYDALHSQANDLAFLIVDRDKAALRSALEDALVSGSSMEQTAEILRGVFSAGVHVLDDSGNIVKVQKADSWFKMVARNEIQTVAINGQMALYEAAGIQKVRWQGSAPCEICAEYDDEVYDIGDVPEDGPPIHPNCVCVLIASDEDLGDWRGTEADRAAAARGNQPEEE